MIIDNNRTVNVKLQRWMVIKLMSACTILADELDSVQFEIIHDLLNEAVVKADSKRGK